MQASQCLSLVSASSLHTRTPPDAPVEWTADLIIPDCALGDVTSLKEYLKVNFIKEQMKKLKRPEEYNISLEAFDRKKGTTKTMDSSPSLVPQAMRFRQQSVNCASVDYDEWPLQLRGLCYMFAVVLHDALQSF